mgnify:CR=1 FL=1
MLVGPGLGSFLILCFFVAHFAVLAAFLSCSRGVSLFPPLAVTLCLNLGVSLCLCSLLFPRFLIRGCYSPFLVVCFLFPAVWLVRLTAMLMLRILNSGTCGTCLGRLGPSLCPVSVVTAYSSLAQVGGLHSGGSYNLFYTHTSYEYNSKLVGPPPRKMYY